MKGEDSGNCRAMMVSSDVKDLGVYEQAVLLLPTSFASKVVLGGFSCISSSSHHNATSSPDDHGRMFSFRLCFCFLACLLPSSQTASSWDPGV